MHILNIAKVEKSKISLTLKKLDNEDKFNIYLTEYLRDRLKRNQVVKILIDNLTEKKVLNLNDITEILIKSQTDRILLLPGGDFY